MTKEEIIATNSKLIWFIANKFYGVDKEDLYQTGVKAILDAYEKYDPREGAKFSTFAYKAIYGAMYKLANQRLLKVSRDIVKLKKNIEKAREMLSQKYGHEASNQEIAAFLEISIEDIELALASFENLVSLDADQKSERSLSEIIPDQNKNNLDDKILINDSMATLDDFEKDIINLRYFHDLTQAETAKVLNTSQVKVSRYEKRSLTKMRDYINL